MIRAAALGLAMLGATQALGEGAPPPVSGARLEPVAWAALAGWAADDHGAALAAFRRGCGARAERAGASIPPALASACAAAAAVSPTEARAFFERWFRPFRIAPDGAPGFLTGYFEPEFAGTLAPAPAYPTPLHARPDDLVTVAAGERLPGLPEGLQGARRLADGRFGPFPARREIDEGALGQAASAVAWLRDPIDRFIMQVQGTGRIRLPDGRLARLSYAGRNGHPYVSLGRLMSRRLNVPPAEMTMDRLVERLRAEPDPNRAWIWENPSYVFFRVATELDPASGPIGGAGHPLTAGRSVAADRALWAYNLPVWLSGSLPTTERGVDEPLARLMVIQDTGSAIVGPSRFDFFHGSGDAAGLRAGLTRHGVDAVILWPVGSR